MIKKFFKAVIISSVFLTLFFVSSRAFAAAATTTYKNLGFLQGNIWYSKDPFYDGDKIRVYSAVFNSSAYDLLGTAEFYDNDKPIGKMEFSVASGGKLKEVWADWQATLGNHKISAKIIKAQISKIGSPTETIVIESGQSGVDERFVDISPAKKAELEKLEKARELANATGQESASTFAGEANNSTGPQTKISDVFKSSATTTTGKAEDIAQKMFDFAFGQAKSTLNTVNSLADTQAQKIEVKKEELKKEIAQESKPSAISHQPSAKTPTTTPNIGATSSTTSPISGFSLDSPVKSAYLLILIIVGYVLSHKFILYAILVLIVYKVLRFIFGRLSDWRHSQPTQPKPRI